VLAKLSPVIKREEEEERGAKMIEYLVALLTIAVAVNCYYDNRLFPSIYARYRKYFHVLAIMVGGALFALSLRASRDWQGAMHATGHLLPDELRRSLHPLMDLTERGAMNIGIDPSRGQSQRISTRREARTVFARSVSESRKKLVAGQQHWRCALCRELLPPTYEVDHIVRLEFGGSNEVNNLQALCPNCHRMKTMVEK